MPLEINTLAITFSVIQHILPKDDMLLIPAKHHKINEEAFCYFCTEWSQWICDHCDVYITEIEKFGCG